MGNATASRILITFFAASGEGILTLLRHLNLNVTHSNQSTGDPTIDLILLLLQFGLAGVGLVLFFRGDIVPRKVLEAQVAAVKAGRDDLLALHKEVATATATILFEKTDRMVSDNQRATKEVVELVQQAAAANRQTVELIGKVLSAFSEHDRWERENTLIIQKAVGGLTKGRRSSPRRTSIRRQRS